MNLLAKLFFVLLAVGGVVLVFYVSWFWRALIIPMILLLILDVVLSLFKKKS